MALVPGDWTVTRSTGAIRYTGAAHTGAATYVTAIELHRWLQDLADDPEYTGDDEVDITTENPSQRITDNYIILLGNYNIDQTTSEHIYDGSIVQGTGGTEEIWDAIKNFGNASLKFQIMQNGALATNFWDQAGGGLNPDPAQGVSHQFILKVRTAGADIDGRRLLGLNRTYENTYGEFPINGTARGINVLALSDADDLNNNTASATVATWTGITNITEGYANIDADANGADEFYYSEWNRDIYSINQFYERMKYLTRDGETALFYGIEGQIFRGITHEFVVDSILSGPFNAVEPVSWPTGTGQMLAINSVSAPTKMWIQLLTGVAPGDGDLITGGTSGATVNINVTVTSRTALITTPFVGASTGSALIGSYGLGLEAADLGPSDKVFDLDNTQITPPNNVTYDVNGVVIGEDRVLVAPWDGVTLDNEGDPAIDFSQLTLQTTLSTGTETAVVVTSPIPTDTPSSGDIRIELDSGVYKEQPYLSYTGSTFTIASTDFSGDNATNPKNVWIAYIDKTATATTESFSGVYLADRDLVVLVRDGGGTPIKQYITSGLLTTNGGSATVTRTSDL